MKTKNHFIFMFFVLVAPFFIKAQTAAYKDEHNHSHDEWQALKFADGSNEKDRVLFYTKGTECTGEHLTLAKIINRNPYMVRLSYQLNAKSPVENVMIPANGALEGSCTAADANTAKLSIRLPEGKTKEEQEKTNAFILSHISISKVQ
ncbi:MAG: hypothetical protein JST67_09315 [Bacteroidetes bacterium]|nr:hypothetical protein [Bacteroidota bacterium]